MSNATTAPVQWASIAEVADMLSVNPKTIRRYIASGVIKAKRFGPQLIRIDVASVAELGRPIGWADR